MRVIPAIDLRGGLCVRLRQGDYDRETVFGDDPAAMAERWESEGATLIHLVDLDGAKAGRPINVESVKRIIRRVKVPCQLGGGVRDRAMRQQIPEIMRRVAWGDLRSGARVEQVIADLGGVEDAGVHHLV
jgi:phosphoribosylformimino-5-aminoimidazole carboxamide ribonucleotide (ProFAR) isomerase